MVMIRDNYICVLCEQTCEKYYGTGWNNQSQSVTDYGKENRTLFEDQWEFSH